MSLSPWSSSSSHPSWAPFQGAIISLSSLAYRVSYCFLRGVLTMVVPACREHVFVLRSPGSMGCVRSLLRLGYWPLGRILGIVAHLITIPRLIFWGMGVVFIGFLIMLVVHL